MLMQVMAPGSPLPPSGQMEGSWNPLGDIWDWGKGIFSGDTSVSISNTGGTVRKGGIEYSWGTDAQGNPGWIPKNIADTQGTPAPAFIPATFFEQYGTFILLGGVALAVYFVTK